MRELLEQLLYAAFNVGGNAPTDLAGEEALRTIRSLADGAENPDVTAGRLLAARLYLEVMTQDDPRRYAAQEIEKGLDGRRYQWDGAGS